METGGSTALSTEPDMRYAVVDSGRRSLGAVLDVRIDRLWRATERDTVRNITIEDEEFVAQPADVVLSLKRNFDVGRGVIAKQSYDSE